MRRFGANCPHGTKQARCATCSPAHVAYWLRAMDDRDSALTARIDALEAERQEARDRVSAVRDVLADVHFLVMALRWLSGEQVGLVSYGARQALWALKYAVTDERADVEAWADVAFPPNGVELAFRRAREDLQKAMFAPWPKMVAP